MTTKIASVGLDNMSKTVDVETLRDIRRMCEIVLNNTFGNRELDSLALYVGHHPLILNSDNSDYEKCGCGSTTDTGVYCQECLTKIAERGN